MSRLSGFADDHYVNVHLTTELDLPKNRETVLHFFEIVKRKYPSMRNFYARDRDDYVLEEDKDDGAYRWCSLEPRRLASGVVNPDTLEAAYDQHAWIFEGLPAMLAASPLDCESLNLMYGFDYSYRGNHTEILLEALGLPPALELLGETIRTPLAYEPTLTWALDEACRMQARVHFETRTLPAHVRTGEFPEEQLTAYLSVRRLGSLDPAEGFGDVLKEMIDTAEEIIDGMLIEHVLRPLQRQIAVK